MELLESDDPKSRLLKKSAMQRNVLEEEAKLISVRTEKALTNALIIGAALAATYFLVREFSGSRKRKKASARQIKGKTTEPEESEVTLESAAPGLIAQLGTAMAIQATEFLLTLAKEKLVAYLQSQMQKKTDIDERS